jgi:hypothetical protein
MLMVLRLLCIQSVTAGGIRSNKLDGLRKLIAQTYGYEQLFTLCNLEKSGSSPVLEKLVIVIISYDRANKEEGHDVGGNNLRVAKFETRFTAD